ANSYTSADRNPIPKRPVIPNHNIIFLKSLFLIWYIAYTLVKELVSNNIVMKKTSPKPKISSDEGPPAVEYFNARYVTNKLANNTVSPHNKNQSTKHIFFPSKVSFLSSISNNSGYYNILCLRFICLVIYHV